MTEASASPRRSVVTEIGTPSFVNHLFKNMESSDTDGRLTRRRTSHGIGEPPAPPPLPNPPAWHGLASGCIAGASGVLIGHAFDTAKVQAQVGNSGAKGGGATRLTPSSLFTLYRGIVPPLVSTGAIRSLYFGIYEVTRPNVSRLVGHPEDSVRTVFVAGAATGMLTAPVTAPMQRLKLVQQVQGGSLRDCFARLMRSGGLFRGLGLHCLLETIGSGCYLSAYAVCKAQLRRAGVGGRPRDPPDLPGASASGRGANPPEPLALRVLSGMFAGVCGWISIYPLDVLRSRIMSVVPPLTSNTGAGADGAVGGTGAKAVAKAPVTAARTAPPAAGARSAAVHGTPVATLLPLAPTSSPTATSSLYEMVSMAVKETYANGGVRGFFRGITFTLLRAAPVAGVVLPVYDASKAWLANAAMPMA